MGADSEMMLHGDGLSRVAKKFIPAVQVPHVGSTQGQFGQRYRDPPIMKKQKKAPSQSVDRKPKKKSSSDDLLQFEGVVVESLPSANFRVQLKEIDQIILCTVKGKIRQRMIKVLVGDRVAVEMPPYHLTKGRISFRYKD